ncbi:MOSC domain-containing protein [Lapillicoccus jejuensis]|uniref:MOSC domain-containing protein n=1 Tax=Lapillicoccus jejuensis TaxID=402171 RepID=UPI001FE85881|nr:MOSC domain-containing protein [Lapillicoccus jejuensis]
MNAPSVGPPDHPIVVAVCRDDRHRFSKAPQPSLTLLEGLGVEGDAHAGTTVQHRSRVRRDPTAPNLRQVHLLPTALLDRVRREGHDVGPGDLGENLLVDGLHLHALPTGTRLHVGGAVLRVTGLRNPCRQIDAFSPGLLGLVVGRDDDGHVVRRGGVMAVVERGGVVRPGDGVRVETPAAPYVPLEPV